MLGGWQAVVAFSAGLSVMLGLDNTGALAEDVSAQAGAAALPSQSPAANLPPGYLARADLPDSLALLPPPPMPGSAALARDEEARAAAGKLRGTARYAQAANDADLGHIPEDFSCAAGVAIGKDTTPRLYALLGRTMIDVGLSTYGAKNKYQRVRPFVVHGENTCYPKDEAMLRSDGSYPSGHSAIGWGLALVLAELRPGRANALFQRGRDFGQSRVVCEAHWQSDVDAGRVIAAATVARLHSNTAFQVDVAAARAELMGAKPPDSAGCAAETAALAG